MRVLLVLGLIALAAALYAFPGPRQCPEIADAFTTTGWQEYRADRISRAETAFRAAATHCPDHREAQVGLGYVALRNEANDTARAILMRVVASEPLHVDALVGLGLAEWRLDRHDAARRAFERALRVDPNRADVRQHLARLPPPMGPPPIRPPLVLPDSVEWPARTARDRFEVRAGNGWTPFYIKGVNLGIALPGHFPSEFPDSATYAAWVEGIAAMGANTIRAYTIHPPAFYQALAAHNRRVPERPLWLLQGVWAELPPNDDYYQAAWNSAFRAELGKAVDVLHGRADVPRRAGHAAGYYTADVAAWTLGLIIGREWEPFSVAAFNEHYPDRTAYAGRYLSVAGASPMDAWLGSALDYVVGYETDTYRTQRPVAYTNWPTLDPMAHASEIDTEEEFTIRGIAFDRARRDYDEDRVSVAAIPAVTEAFRAGYFAAFHVYPYYPDFLLHDPKYAAARSPFGPSSYFGYLQDLKSHFPGVPVVIAEYGVPASWGIAHFNPQGWHHGGHSEAEMASTVVRLTREIEAAGMAGGAVFGWIDEWFKRSWLSAPLELPPERSRMWWNRMDPEQHYGVLAVEPEPRLGGSIVERRRGWDTLPPLYAAADGSALRAHADEAYLWLQLRGPFAQAPEVLVGFDVLDAKSGGKRFPGAGAPSVPVGLEFVLQIASDTARLVAWPRANPYRVRIMARGWAKRDRRSPITGAPPGFFAGSYTQELNEPFLARADADGRFDPLFVVVNRARIGGDSTNYLGMGYDRGILPAGPLPDGAWERTSDGEVLEVRIPWTLLDITDPSSHRVVGTGGDGTGTAAPTTDLDGIRIVAAARRAQQQWQVLPSTGQEADVASFTWPGWDQPRYRIRYRPVYFALRDLFEELGVNHANN